MTHEDEPRTEEDRKHPHEAGLDSLPLARLRVYKIVEGVIGRELTHGEHSAIKSELVQWQTETKNTLWRKLEAVHNQFHERPAKHRQDDPGCAWHRDSADAYHCSNCCAHCKIGRPS